MIYINKSEELLKLVAENPDLPVVPMVDSEVCGGDEYGYWLGEFGGLRQFLYISIRVDKTLVLLTK